MPPALAVETRKGNRAMRDPAFDDVVRSRITARHAELKAARAPREAGWADCVRAYNLKAVRRWYNGRSRLVDNSIFVLVERLHPRVCSLVFGASDFFDALPNTPDLLDRVTVNKELLKLQMERDGFRFKGSLLVKDSLIVGTGIWKQRWLYDVRTVRRPVRVDEPYAVGPHGPTMAPVWKMMESEEEVFDGPSGDVRDIMRVWVDPRIDDWQRGDIIEDGYVSLNWCRQMERAGVIVGVDRFVGEGRPEVPTGAEATRDNAQRRSAMNGAKANLYKYTEFWGQYPIDAAPGQEDVTETRECVIGIINDKWVVRIEENPFATQAKPYFPARPIPVSGEAYGKSIVEMALDEWTALTDTKNQGVDAGTFALCPMILAGPGNSKKASYSAAPGKVLHYSGAPLTPFRFENVAPIAWQMEERFKRSLEDTFAAPALLSGQPSAGSDSATEASIQHQEAGSRIQGYAFMLEETWIKPMLYFMHNLNQMFLDVEDAVRMKGPRGFQFRSITRADVVGDYSFVAVGSRSMASKAVLGAQYANFFNTVIVPLAPLFPGLFNMEGFVKDYASKVLDIDYPEIYVNAVEGQGRPLPIEEVLISITNGHQLKPDPRQDFAQTLPFVSDFIVTYGDRMLPRLRKAFTDHLMDMEETARMVAMQRLLMIHAQRVAEQQAASGDKGGRNGKNQPKVGHADGQGGTLPRELMMSMSGGPQGAM